MATSEFVFGAPPDASFHVAPTEEQIEFFRRHGYVQVDRLTTDEEIEWLAEVVGDLFDSGRSFVFEPGSELGRQPPFRLAQSVHPEVQYPELLATVSVRNARRFAAALLGAGADDVSAWGYALRMPPAGTLVGWHQDEAYWLPEVEYRAVCCWLPVRSVAPSDHTIEFIPGSHRRGVRTHRHAGALATYLLRADEVDEQGAVGIELPLGGATFHHPRALLRVRPRTGDEPFDVFAVTVQQPPALRRRRRRWPWIDAMRDVAGPPPDPLTYVADGRIAVVR